MENIHLLFLDSNRPPQANKTDHWLAMLRLLSKLNVLKFEFPGERNVD